MKFLFDVGVGRVAERWLEATGHDVERVRTLNPSMPDAEILAIAAREGCMVVTMDKDFGELVYRSGEAHAGVLLLRMDDAGGEAKREVLESIVTHHLEDIRGKFAVYQRGRLRVRS